MLLAGPKNQDCSMAMLNRLSAPQRSTLRLIAVTMSLLVLASCSSTDSDGIADAQGVHQDATWTDTLAPEADVQAPPATECVVIKPVAKRIGLPTVGSVAVAFSVTTCGGKTVADLGSDDFSIYEDGQPISATESGVDILPRQAVTYVTLVLDHSPSVKAAGGLEDAVSAAKEFAASLMTEDPLSIRVAVAVFSIAFELRQAHTSDLTKVQAAIDGLLTDETGVNTTNLYGALIDAVEHNKAAQGQLFNDMRGGVLTQGHVLLFTDGSDQAAAKTYDDALDAVNATTDEVRMVAFGTEVDVEVLESLATGGAYVGASSDDLGALFATIAEQIQTQRESLYVLGYCSPKVAGVHELTLEMPGQGTSPPISFSADGWLEAIQSGEPSCQAEFFAEACAEVQCGGLWCGGCVEICTADLVCGCSDPTFTGAHCDQCANPELAPPDCTTCVDPSFTGDTCDECADPIFTGEACDVCADPAWTGPSCNVPSPCPEAPDGTPCDDDDACTVDDACSAGVCGGTSTGIICDDGNPCTVEGCDPATGGCVSTHQAGPCEDGNGCTVGDYCASGACTPGVNQCACQADVDCAWKEDADLCNGTLICEGSGSTSTCIIDPASVVACSEIDSPCTVSQCDPASGECASSPVADGTPCAPATLCSGVPTCQAGLCEPGVAIVCDDGITWTEDACEDVFGCVYTPIEGAACDDDSACTSGDTIIAGVCTGAQVVCDDGDFCTGVEACDPAQGCYIQDAAPCPDDGDPCTMQACDSTAQACTSTSMMCGDGDLCTLDSCEGGVCINAPIASCDGCTSDEDCDDGNACTENLCYNNPGSPGEWDCHSCGLGEECALPGLLGWIPLGCDDDDPCTVDTCDPIIGCTSTLDPACDGDANASGCSDGTREGFLIGSAYGLIAGCSGGWDVPGIHHAVGACENSSGNDSDNPNGVGCNVADLCSEDWHVCLGKNDVQAHNPDGCEGIMDGAKGGQFFLARTSSTGAFNCAPDTIGSPDSVNDLFGCGDLGCPATESTCAPLQLGSHDKCKALGYKPTSSCACQYAGELPVDDPKYVEGDMETVVCQPNSGGCGWCKPLDYWAYKLDEDLPETWECGTNTTAEANNVVKTGPELGGVLCCKDL
jgi:hypothetical protein